MWNKPTRDLSFEPFLQTWTPLYIFKQLYIRHPLFPPLLIKAAGTPMTLRLLYIAANSFLWLKNHVIRIDEIFFRHFLEILWSKR